MSDILMKISLFYGFDLFHGVYEARGVKRRTKGWQNTQTEKKEKKRKGVF